MKKFQLENIRLQLHPAARWGIFALLSMLSAVSQGAPKIPNHIFARDAATGTSVLVDKATHSAYLIDIDHDQPRLVRTFDNLLFGENGGDKVKEGDKRTPEGVYRIKRFIPDEKLAPIYGSGAFPIDYPNPLDRLEGRNGSGIWLHGKDDNNPQKNATRGCVAFNNDEIGILRGLVRPNTPVVITQSAEFVDPAEYQLQRQELLGTLDHFIESWKRGDIEQLDLMLHPKFKGLGGIGKQAWLKQKQTLKKIYPYRHIEVSNVYAFKENGYQVVFDYTQFYCASNVISRGKKRLFFKKDGDKLQLITETFSRLPTEPFIEERVKSFVEGWLSAWQATNLESYLAFYSEKFSGPKGRDINAWRAYKERLFAQRPDQKIEIGEIHIKRLQGDKYRVRFKQRYQSKAFSDFGTKTLLLVGCPGEFKIAAESWRAIH